MDFWTIVVFIACVVGIYRWAEAWGRNASLWAVSAVLVSPIITGLVLLVVGKKKPEVVETITEK